MDANNIRCGDQQMTKCSNSCEVIKRGGASNGLVTAPASANAVHGIRSRPNAIWTNYGAITSNLDSAKVPKHAAVT